MSTGVADTIQETVGGIIHWAGGNDTPAAREFALQCVKDGDHRALSVLMNECGVRSAAGTANRLRRDYPAYFEDGKK